MEMNRVKKILVIEDDIIKIDSLKSELKIRGFNVVAGQNGAIPPSPDGGAEGRESSKGARCGCDDGQKCSCLSNRMLKTSEKK
jgi:hypothetical protein